MKQPGAFYLPSRPRRDGIYRLHRCPPAFSRVHSRSHATSHAPKAEQASKPQLGKPNSSPVAVGFIAADGMWDWQRGLLFWPDCCTHFPNQMSSLTRGDAYTSPPGSVAPPRKAPFCLGLPSTSVPRNVICSSAGENVQAVTVHPSMGTDRYFFTPAPTVHSMFFSQWRCGCAQYPMKRRNHCFPEPTKKPLFLFGS